MGSIDKSVFIVAACNIIALVMVIVSSSIGGEPPDKDDIKLACDDPLVKLAKFCDFVRAYQTGFSFNIFALVCAAVALVFLVICQIVKKEEKDKCCLFTRIPDAVGLVFMLLNVIILPTSFNKNTTKKKFFDDADNDYVKDRVGFWACDFVACFFFAVSFALPFFL